MQPDELADAIEGLGPFEVDISMPLLIVSDRRLDDYRDDLVAIISTSRLYATLQDKASRKLEGYLQRAGYRIDPADEADNMPDTKSEARTYREDPKVVAKVGPDGVERFEEGGEA